MTTDTTDDDPLTTDRTYLHVTPSDDPLHPEQVTRSITRLHRIDAGGFLEADSVPTYEILLVATGESGDNGDRQLDWYVGVDTDGLDTIERTLRNCLPRSVDIEYTTLAYGTSLGLPLDTDSPAPLADWDVAGLEWEGVGTRPDDWQCPLTDLEKFDADNRPGDWPLTTVLDGLATTDAPALVQMLITPKPDWSATAEDRRGDLEINNDLWRHGLGKALIDGIFMDTSESSQTTNRHHRPNRHRRTDHADSSGRASPRRIDDPSIPQSNARRMEALETVDTRQSFAVNARAVAFGTDRHAPEGTLRAVEPAFDQLQDASYRIDATNKPFSSADANTLLERIVDRTPDTDPTALRHSIPFTRNASPAIVADRHAVGAFICTDGPSLSPEATRALEPTPTDRQGLPLPARSVLDRYLDTPGLAVGHPRTVDRTALDAMFALPPAIQDLHTGIYGSSGAGKTALAQHMGLHNHEATAGATIYIDQKGDGGPEDYAKLHYARHDHLDDVYYFDCREFLPVLPLLSVEPLLEAGIDRERAVSMVTETYVATLDAASGWEAFSDAQAALQALKYLVTAQFDPVHGADTVSHHDVQRATQRFRETGNPPPVSDGTLHTKLVGVASDNPDQFATIMGAVERRLAMATDDSRLAPLFTATAENADAEAFDLREQLDEDCVIVFDMGGYGENARRMLAVAVIGQLWRALERRAETGSEDPPLVNCYLEEAADIAATGILDTLLSQGRAFGVGITLAMQFPEQIRTEHPRVYRELLNDVGTTITGSVGVDDGLAQRLATGDIDADAMAARLRALDRGEWIVRPAAPFADRKPRPFQLTSPPLPPGHPEGAEPLNQTRQALFFASFTLAKHRTRDAHGVDIGRGAAGTPDPADVEADGQSAPTLAQATATIPNTNRFPDCITYIDEPPFPLVCPTCDSRYAATPDGMRRAIECHHSLADVDRADIPVCSLDLQLTSGELAASDYSAAQLRLLTAVYMAHQQRFDPDLEYDIVWDSMTDLQAYVGIESHGVDELIDEGLLTVDCNRPHKLYTVTPEGRDAIGINHREGIAHGDGAGDLSESSLHVAMVEVGARLMTQEFVGPDQPGVECRRYPEVEDGRLDAAVVDADGEFVATLEAERINNDRAEAIPSDFDLMADCEPDEAWWIVKARADGHAVLEALHDAADGEPRVETTYSASYAPRRYSIDEPGLTAVHTFEYARDTLLEAPRPDSDG